MLKKKVVAFAIRLETTEIWGLLLKMMCKDFFFKYWPSVPLAFFVIYREGLKVGVFFNIFPFQFASTLETLGMSNVDFMVLLRGFSGCACIYYEGFCTLIEEASRAVSLINRPWVHLHRCLTAELTSLHHSKASLSAWVAVLGHSRWINFTVRYCCWGQYYLAVE